MMMMMIYTTLTTNINKNNTTLTTNITIKIIKMSEFNCSTPNCNKNATLACPTCIKLGIPPSRFCSQECFKSNWNEHKEIHKIVKQARGDDVKADPNAIPIEFNGFSFTGSLVYLHPHISSL